MWGNIFKCCEDDTKVKNYKLQTFRIQYETLKLHDDKSIATFFLGVDEVVNSMRNIGEEIKYACNLEKVLRYLTPKFQAKVSVIEEMDDLQIPTVDQLHGILKTFESKKGGPWDMREKTFKIIEKGKEKVESCYVPEEEDANFVKKLQLCPKPIEKSSIFFN